MFRVINKIIQNKILGKFDIDEQSLTNFCEENKRIWNQNQEKIPTKNGYCFVGLFMVEKWMPWLEQKLIFAKGIQEKKGINPIITDWEYNENLETLYRSYGFDFLSLKK